MGNRVACELCGAHVPASEAVNVSFAGRAYVCKHCLRGEMRSAPDKSREEVIEFLRCHFEEDEGGGWDEEAY